MFRIKNISSLTLLSASLAVAGCGVPETGSTSYPDSVARSESTDQGLVETNLRSADDKELLATAKWDPLTQKVSLAVPSLGLTREGQLSADATLKDVHQLAHSLWAGASQRAQLFPETLSADQVKALFELQRPDVQPAYLNGTQVGVANLTYNIIYSPEKGYLAFNDQEQVLWGWQSQVPATALNVAALKPTGLSVRRTTVCWYVRIPDGGGGILTIYGCFNTN